MEALIVRRKFSASCICLVALCLFFEPFVTRDVGASVESTDDSVERAAQLIVMIEGQFDEAGNDKTLGGGIIFGRDDDHVYIVTANHVVRKGSRQVNRIQVKFRHKPEQAMVGELLENFDQQLDLAVLKVKSEKSDQKGKVGCIPFDQLADPKGLKRGVRVYPVGYANGIPWAMPVLPDAIAQLTGNEFAFQSAFISAGHSGGGVINESGELLGLILKDQPPFGSALSMEKTLEKLKEWGYFINLRQAKYGRKRPLFKAIQEKDVVEAKLLIRSCHYDVNEQDVEKRATPLYLSAYGGLPELVDELLKAGAKANGTSGDSCAASLISAIQAKEHTLRIIRLLLKYGADPAFKGSEGNCMSAIDAAVKFGNTAILKTLLDFRSWKTSNAKIILHDSLVFSVRFGGTDKIEKMKILLAAGAEINAWNSDGQTALLQAAVFVRDVRTFKFLLEAGAHVDAVPKGSSYTWGGGRRRYIS